jgi:hypothetical protein
MQPPSYQPLYGFTDGAQPDLYNGIGATQPDGTTTPTTSGGSGPSKRWYVPKCAYPLLSFAHTRGQGPAGDACTPGATWREYPRWRSPSLGTSPPHCGEHALNASFLSLALHSRTCLRPCSAHATLAVYPSQAFLPLWPSAARSGFSRYNYAPTTARGRGVLVSNVSAFALRVT